MKRTIAFLGTAAAAMMMAGVANAEGYVGAYYGDNNSTDATSWGVDGAITLGANVQLDANYSRTEDLDLDSYGVGGHFFSRNDSGAWGAYVGYDVASGAGDDVDEFTVAGQMQHFVDRTTLFADLSYSAIEELPFVGDVSTISLQGGLRFFPADNFSVNIGAGYGTLDSDTLGADDFYTLSGGGEWKFDEAPISIFTDVNSFQADGSDATAWRVGARYSFGGTLFERERSGASLSRPSGLLGVLF